MRDRFCWNTKELKQKLKIQHFEENKNGRDFIVGDLHGMYDLLISKMARFEFEPDIDRLFSVGDLVDRGHDSLKCLKLIEEPWFFSVKGNHEDMLVDVVLNDEDPCHYYLSGGEWIAEIDKYDPQFRSLVRKANELPLVMSIETGRGKVWVTHATPRKDWNNPEIDSDEEVEILWSRKEISQMEVGICEHIDPNFISYHGHTVVDEPISFESHPTTHWIDTGAVYGFELTFQQL